MDDFLTMDPSDLMISLVPGLGLSALVRVDPLNGVLRVTGQVNGLSLLAEFSLVGFQWDHSLVLGLGELQNDDGFAMFEASVPVGDDFPGLEVTLEEDPLEMDPTPQFQ